MVFKPRADKILLFLLALAPLAWLLYRLFNGQLGANPPETLNRNLGDWALRFFLITLTISPLKKLLGYNGLIRYRRMLGLFTYFYACLHVCSYLVFDQFFDWGEIIKDIIKRPYITVGMTTLAIITPLAVTSTRRWRQRLKRRWELLHSFAYPGAALAVIHHYWMLKGNHPPTLYAYWLLLILLFRIWPMGYLKKS